MPYARKTHYDYFHVELYLCDQFRMMSDVHVRNNRFSKLTMQIPIHRTVKFNRSFVATASRLWNELELHDHIEMSVSTCKQHVGKKIKS